MSTPTCYLEPFPQGKSPQIIYIFVMIHAIENKGAASQPTL